MPMVEDAVPAAAIGFGLELGEADAVRLLLLVLVAVGVAVRDGEGDGKSTFTRLVPLVRAGAGALKAFTAAGSTPFAAAESREGFSSSGRAAAPEALALAEAPAATLEGVADAEAPAAAADALLVGVASRSKRALGSDAVCAT